VEGGHENNLFFTMMSLDIFSFLCLQSTQTKK